jgi:pimeloyl-ACP methyl ester carboxylesterase
MGRISIDGLGVEYEILGSAASPAVALTPGGRYSMETPGLRELAQELANGGKRVLIWDRPNCGKSDLKFDAPTESGLAADTLIGLIRELQLGPTALAAGSAGSRVSLIAAARSPESVSHLVLWWISGGPVGLMQLAYGYCCDSANLASVGGMQAVAQSASWKDQISSNPEARAMLLRQDAKDFIGHMQRWALAYRPSDDSPVPGMSPENFRTLRMPVLIMRNGSGDVSHSPETTDWVHRLIPHSRIIDPPWPDDEWNQRLAELMLESKPPAFFVNWPRLAPHILEFTRVPRE